VNHLEIDPTDNRRCWLHFPGDVDLNLTFEIADRELLADYVTGPPPANHLCDMNYSGACTAADIIEWVNMANGGGTFGPWLNATTAQACPTLVGQ
jgi:hypothetical protein